jgi:hypothetical protein
VRGVLASPSAQAWVVVVLCRTEGLQCWGADKVGCDKGAITWLAVVGC